MRNALFWLITVFTAQAVNADSEIRLDLVNTIKIGPLSEECLTIIQPDMDLQSKKTMDCLVDISERTTSLLRGITTCARKKPSELNNKVCSIIARQLQEIQQPYNTLMTIIWGKSNLSEEEIKGLFIDGDILNSEINRWYQSVHEIHLD